MYIIFVACYSDLLFLINSFTQEMRIKGVFLFYADYEVVLYQATRSSFIYC